MVNKLLGNRLGSWRPMAILFDLFDTLLLIKTNVDFNEKCLLNVHKFLGANGIDVSFGDFIRVYFEVRKQMYERINKSLEEPHFSVRILETLMRLGYDRNALISITWGAAEAYSEEFMRYVYLDEDAAPVLRSLRDNGYKIGVVSNFTIPECIYKLLDIFGLKDLLDAVIISAEVNKRKPSPEIFAFALNALGVEASRTFFVGDTPDVDIRGARKVGMRTVLIERRSVCITNADDKPDFKIKSLRELLLILKNYS